MIPASSLLTAPTSSSPSWWQSGPKQARLIEAGASSQAGAGHFGASPGNYMAARLLEDGWAIGEALARQWQGPAGRFFAGRADIGALESYSLRAVHWGRLTIKVLRANAVVGALWSPQRSQGRCPYCLLHFSHLQRTWNKAARQGYLTSPPFTGTNPSDGNEEWDGSCAGVGAMGSVTI